MLSIFPVFLLSLSLLSFASAAPTIETHKVEYRNTPVEQLFDGVIEAVHKATISAEVSGRIEELLFDVDDYVPQNAIVVRFRDRDQQAALKSAKASLAEARARLQEASAEFERIKSIYARKLVAKSKLDSADASYKAAQARVDATQGTLTQAEEQLEHTRVRAPYAGIVTQRYVEVGESVNIGQPLMDGLSLEKLRTKVQIPQRYIQNIRETAQARIITDSGEYLQSGQLTLFPVADSSSHSFTVRVDLPAGQHNLYPGMLVKAGFMLGDSKRLFINKQALVQRSEITAVYLLAEDGTIKFRQIRIGESTGDEIEVLAGLDEGEQVILNPQQAVETLKQRVMEK